MIFAHTLIQVLQLASLRARSFPGGEQLRSVFAACTILLGRRSPAVSKAGGAASRPSFPPAAGYFHVSSPTLGGTECLN